MSFTKRLFRHLSVALLSATTLGAAQNAADPAGSATFVVLVQGVRVGSENVSLSRSGNDWILSSTGRLAAPFDLTVSKFEIRYGPDWHPQQMSIEALLRGQPLALSTTFGLTTATSDIAQGLQRASNTQQISPRTIVLPNNFFGAFEALAARAGSAAPGTRLPVFIAPDGETNIVIDKVTPRRVSTVDGTLDLKEFAMSVAARGGTVPLQMWTDARNRLVRVVMPASSVVVVREDVAGVMAREIHITNPGDDETFISGNGFSIGATFTKPAGVTGPAPVVVIVNGPGPRDRDGTTFGIPMIGQLAGALAEAGYAVVRFDGRGTGRSGGRTESAGISEYAEDVIGIVAWLRKRKDVDPNRIALVGYGEGAAIAMNAAAKEKKIRALGLLNAPGRTGREVTSDQQRHLLDRLNLPATERDAKVALQTQLMDSTLRGGSDALPENVRKQAESVWFRSWLQFDPAVTMNKIEQPVLVLHSALNTEMAPAYADRLETLSRARKKTPETFTRKVIVAGTNHLLVPARTGEEDEYGVLESRTISPEFGRAIAQWLKDTLAGK